MQSEHAKVKGWRPAARSLEASDAFKRRETYQGQLIPPPVSLCVETFVTPGGSGCHEHLRGDSAVTQHPTVTEWPHHETDHKAGSSA